MNDLDLEKEIAAINIRLDNQRAAMIGDLKENN